MSDGSISIKLAPDYQMQGIQRQLDEIKQENDIISNEPFFPNVSITDFRNLMRLDGTVTEARLIEALVEAMESCNDDLSQFAMAHQTDGTLENIKAPQIKGKSVLVHKYLRAVHCLAQANLFERYASFDNTNEGDKKMELLSEGIDKLRRDARFALEDIKGNTRLNVELI